MSLPREAAAALDERSAPGPAELVGEYGPLVTSLCRSVFRNEEEARDAAQEAWLEVLESVGGFRGESRFSTWLYAVVYRTVVRKRAEEKRLSLRELRLRYRGTDFAAPDWALPDLRLWAEETCRDCMRGVLLCLDPDSRLVFVFRFVVELPYAEIAAIMEKSEASVRQTASRARKRIAGFLGGDCGLVRPGAVCRYRNERWIKETGLAESFWKLRRMTQVAELYKNSKRVFPKRNFWAAFVGGA